VFINPYFAVPDSRSSGSAKYGVHENMGFAIAKPASLYDWSRTNENNR
jgi:hypothetical protein